MLLPSLERFNPDLLFISAGFDAHYDDMYHFLTEQDLHWVTEQMCAVADRCGGGSGSSCGVISVLEGGYSLSTPLPKPKPTSRATVHVPVPTTSATTTTSTTEAALAVHIKVEDETAALQAQASPEFSSSNATDSTAAAITLGRGGRLKAKKAAVSGASSVVATAPTSTSTVAAAALPTAAPVLPPTEPAVGFGLFSSPTKGVSAVAQDKDMHSMYAQRPGDGGLVKG